MWQVCKQVCMQINWWLWSMQKQVCLSSPRKRCNQAGHMQLIDERLLGAATPNGDCGRCVQHRYGTSLMVQCMWLVDAWLNLVDVWLLLE